MTTECVVITKNQDEIYYAAKYINNAIREMAERGFTLESKSVNMAQRGDNSLIGVTLVIILWFTKDQPAASSSVAAE